MEGWREGAMETSNSYEQTMKESPPVQSVSIKQ